MPSSFAKERKKARQSMIDYNTPKKTNIDVKWSIECVECKCEIYSLKKIRVDQTLYGHTTVIVDGIYKYVAPQDYETMGVYNDVDIYWTCLDCNKI